MTPEKMSVVAEKALSSTKESSQESLTSTESKTETTEEVSLREVEKISSNRSALHLAAILCALYLSVFLAALDQTITATAIPTIASNFRSADGYTWVGGAYLLAQASATPVWAKLSDIWGHRPIFLINIGIFFCSSAMCALARNMNMLIAGRAMQGAAGGALLQLPTIIISDIFCIRRRSLFLGLTELMWALAGGVGPVLGGALAEHVSWRWIFWINLPTSGVAFLLITAFLDTHDPEMDIFEGLKAVDWFGSATILAMTLMLLLGIDLGVHVLPWKSPVVISLLVLGCLTFGLFYWSEKRAKYPLFLLGLFGNLSNVASLVVNFTQAFVYMAAEYYLPLYLQSAKDASPTHSGLLIFPLTLVQALAAITSGVLIHRTGEYCFILYAGMLLVTVGNGLYITLQSDTSISTIIGMEILAGIGIGLTFAPPLIAIHANVLENDVTTATSTFGYIHNLSTAMATVIGSAVIQAGMKTQAAHLEAAGLPLHLIEAFVGTGATSNVEMIGEIENDGQKAAVKDAFTSSLRNLWILCTILSAVGLLVTVLVSRKRLLKSEQAEENAGDEQKETKRNTGK